MTDMTEPLAKEVADAYQTHLLLVTAEAANAMAALTTENERLRAKLDLGDLGTLHAMAHGSPGYPESDLCHRISRVVGWHYDKAGRLVKP